MAWLPDGEKILMIRLFVLTQLTNVTDGQTNRQTPHDGIGRAYASHRAAKKWLTRGHRAACDNQFRKSEQHKHECRYYHIRKMFD